MLLCPLTEQFDWTPGVEPVDDDAGWNREVARQDVERSAGPGVAELDATPGMRMVDVSRLAGQSISGLRSRCPDLSTGRN